MYYISELAIVLFLCENEAVENQQSALQTAYSIDNIGWIPAYSLVEGKSCKVRL